MKHKILALCLACLFGFGCATTSGIVTQEKGMSAYRETDRFTGDTTIYSTKRRISMVRARCLYFYCAAPEKGFPPLAVQALFGHLGQKRWKYLEYHVVSILADGVPVEILGEPSHDGDVGLHGKLTEHVFFSLAWPEFLKMVDAGKVEYRIGAYEFKIDAKTKAEMRSFRDEILK